MNAVERPFLSVAVFLEAALEKNNDARLAAGRRSEQQQKAASYFGARARRAEVIGETFELVINTEQIVRICSMKSANVPDQWAARCFCVKATRLRTKSPWR